MTFQEVAAAQVRAWRQAADKMQALSRDFSADNKARIEAVAEQMKVDASGVEVNFQKLAKAGTESWTALNTALAESCTAFDRASKTAWDAFRQASSGAQRG